MENGPASGGSTVKNAFLSIAAGFHDTVLVAGAEKMRHVSPERITDLVATMTHPFAEYVHGVTLPSLAAMLARLYMVRFGVTSDDLGLVAVKNHYNGSRNPYAHIQQAITLDGILHSRGSEVNNPVIAEPMRLYDSCPVSDGSAAVLLCESERLKQFADNGVQIVGVGHATDTHALHDRTDPARLDAVRVASHQAFEMARLKPSDIDVAELHDAFTILEIVESEEAGFFGKGKGHEALREGVTSLGGNLPINTSGGLKARGHPLGATGIAQLVELTWQLQGEAVNRQVQGANRAFSCNLGGFANNAVAFVLERCQ